ncbi:MAG: DUF6691 family protein [Catalinimonas sp.]
MKQETLTPPRPRADATETPTVRPRPSVGIFLLYGLLGIAFGVILMKAEVVSWLRIQEMFRFQSFHMYGVIGSAILVGALSLQGLRRFGGRTITGERVVPPPPKQFHRGQLYGGLLFGFGWALTGACPGPLFALVGGGFGVMAVSLLAAVVGTWTYGRLRERLPH